MVPPGSATCVPHKKYSREHTGALVMVNNEMLKIRQKQTILLL